VFVDAGSVDNDDVGESFRVDRGQRLRLGGSLALPAF